MPPPKLSLVPTDEDEFHPLAITPEIVSLLTDLLRGMRYGVVSIHVEAGCFHKFTETRNHRAPDSVRGSQAARRRETGR